ncbi:hypothetical protein HOA92_07440 [archaeon]|nr:hypothetical protein [archaeon]MBT6762847.1 hypothetical protein [archaeon]
MSNITLHSGQIAALEQLTKILSEPQPIDKARILALTGISGVGKDTAWKTIAADYPDKIFTPHYMLRSPIIGKGYTRVTTTTQSEFSKYSRDPVTAIIVKGMNEEETVRYLDSSGKDFGKISMDQLIEHSLGIPLLADRLLQNPDLDESQLAMIAGSYLRVNFSYQQAEEIRLDKTQLEKYFNLPVSESIKTTFENLSYRQGKIDFSWDLSRILKKQALVKKRYGYKLLNPFLKCPASSDLYKSVGRDYGNDPRLNLFAANLSEEQCKLIEHELFPRVYLNSHTGTRFDMFSADFRKVTMQMQDHQKEHVICEEGIAEHFRSYQDYSIQGNLPITSLQGKKGTFKFHAHEHDGMVTNQLHGAMAVESLLQHMGVPYIIDFGMLKKGFKYHPKTNQLEEIDQFDQRLSRVRNERSNW